jgi:YesN/AraC family two-component response regulator
MPPSGRILVVDDDPALIEAAQATLVPPHRVFSARKGIQALEVLEQQVLDLVLLDYILPDGSGLELLRVIRRTAPTLPIILMTGFGSEDVAVESFRSGARDYLKKPFTALDLLARVEGVLRLGTGRRATAPVDTQALESTHAAGEHLWYGENLQRALLFVEGHLHTTLSLDDVAREAAMSKFHFCRVIKRVTGLTFRAFLAHRRISRAIELLKDAQRSLTDIYLDVGFKDMSHFGRVFRRVTGRPPSRFRRALRVDHNGANGFRPGTDQEETATVNAQEQSKKKQAEASERIGSRSKL